MLDRTPPSLLHDIILVDDGSTDEWIVKGQLDREVRTISKKVHLYHTGARIGLIRGRFVSVEMLDYRVGFHNQLTLPSWNQWSHRCHVAESLGPSGHRQLC